MATQGGALRVFYQGRTTRGTTPSSRRLQAALAPLLDGELARWYRVEASAYDHFQIPRRHGWRLLVDVAADVPDARVLPLEPGGAGELEEFEGVDLSGEQAEPELEELEPPPLTTLPEPVPPPSREVPSAESEAALWGSEEDRVDEASSEAPFGEGMVGDVFGAGDDVRMELALAADEEPEELSEGVDLSGEQAEPELEASDFEE
jgi:hypothetical protein